MRIYSATLTIKMRLWRQFHYRTWSVVCRKGGFISMRHNEIRDLTAEL